MTLAQAVHSATIFEPQARAEDLYLFSEGRHGLCYQWLGALPEIRQEESGDGENARWVHGVCFRLWQPEAEWLALVGPFNHWNAQSHRMIPLAHRGVWEIFVPGLPEGSVYRFEAQLHGEAAPCRLADPCARQWADATEQLARVPATKEFVWRDGAWLGRRSMAKRSSVAPTLYRFNPGETLLLAKGDPEALQRSAAELVTQARAAGATAVVLSLHPKAGEISHFAPDQNLGTPDDWKCWIDACHRANLAVLLDWPGGTQMACFHGLSPESKSLLLSSARYWLDEFHLDGLRVTGLTGLMASDPAFTIRFFQELHLLMQREFPGTWRIAAPSSLSSLSISQLTTAVHQGGLGFSFLEKDEG